MTKIEELLQRVFAGNSAAWREFQTIAEPTIASIIRRHRLMKSRGLAVLPDDVREVLVATLERLKRSDFANLRRFVVYPRDPSISLDDALDDWLFGATDFVIREHVSNRFGAAPKPSADEAVAKPPSKRDLHTLAERLDGAAVERNFVQTVGMTLRLKVAEIFEHADAAFEAHEAQAFRMYFQAEREYDEIARALKLKDADSAKKLVRALTARVRYHYEALSDTAAD